MDMRPYNMVGCCEYEQFINHNLLLRTTNLMDL